MTSLDPVSATRAYTDQIPLFDPKRDYESHRAEIDARIWRVLEHGAFVNGPEVDELEAALCGATGAQACVACANGTDALVLAHMGLGIGPGDAVFVPAFTYVATAGAVRMAGATPVFCDVDPATANLDPSDLARRVDRVARAGCLRPRAVIAVDLFGLPADYNRIQDVADAFGLHVIADAAQSMGASTNGVAVGGLAPVTAVSFFPTKPFGCAGDGGAVFTHDPEFAQRLRLLRTHGTDASRTAIALGMNNRLDTLQAAILLAKLPYLRAERDRREQLARLYDAHLPSGIAPAPRHTGSKSAWALYTVRMDDRDDLKARLADAGIAAGVYYAKPVHLHPAYRDFGEGPGSLPNSERLAETVLSLPLTARMYDGDALAVIASVTDAQSR
jgi:dTDP-4-amino-4,6-dideoxygalactose transaminase